MLILGIETSCDETAIAVVEDGEKVLSNLVASQVEFHREFYGVVPEVASRKHLETILPLLKKSLEKAGVGLGDINGVGVTCGPGLLGSLLVGVMVAKGIAFSLNLPLVGINHLEAHLHAAFLSNPSLSPPLVGLVISGGHTELVYINKEGEYKLLGSTRDDAVGEAFDKVARILNLGYPGGPIIEKIARKGDPSKIKLPLPQFKEETFDFSFSGIKTAVLYLVRKMKEKRTSLPVEDIAASFQLQVAKIIQERIAQAVNLKKVKDVVIGGGVASNRFIKEFLLEKFKGKVNLYIPPPELCTDNAAMVAALAYHKIKKGQISSLSLEAQPGLKIG
ncbi:tRNA (adenosine(37)-N6)-threonylcarbamoyltransferase complex transferase subunit TsaD [Candidatus Aerophobetes bacterium]|uniref:tRNA N6-adenosine threonylcarbamoyltransferase n=1 Tax=Aerophobetes bacterium TaxID=2030807 RepID=A0A7V5HY68_UNCAE|nr:tRNA (adenosine(37)-N6)-threonylcarbamoyltransferase complex transferase subunit TsaD [Candidatus Aerophobetes bacterium]HHF98068.1 tRNA (adenosine(37)-N6)-threonylcarbamoyltransferase complex transferase subunit TsaD [Candidatus Aerophobetes bacterium]